MLLRAWSQPFTTKSDFARQHTDEVSTAASRGTITTLWPDGSLTRMWRITPKGLKEIFSCQSKTT